MMKTVEDQITALVYGYIRDADYDEAVSFLHVSYVLYSLFIGRMNKCVLDVFFFRLN